MRMLEKLVHLNNKHSRAPLRLDERPRRPVHSPKRAPRRAPRAGFLAR
jgi:hypothetical protein